MDKWPRILRRDQIGPHQRAWRAWVAAEKRRWETRNRYQTFLRHHVPGVAPVVEACYSRLQWYQSVDRSGEFKWNPVGCNQQPWCIFCMKREENRRVMKTFDRFHRCTPALEQPRFIHVVQTASLTEDGKGFGLAASRDIAGFGQVVWAVLREMYGEGIGAVMSYQDFGERGFAKRHPHMDLTLNGWRLGTVGAEHTPRVELRSGGYERWQATYVAAALRMDPEARQGNFQVRAVREGTEAYYRMLRYQMREMVDLRKLEYDPHKGVVYWHEYQDARRQRFEVAEWKAGLAEYQWRLRRWGSDDEPEIRLHRYYGILSDRQVRRTQKAMGGVSLPHGDRCPCAECGDWERVYPDHVDAHVSRAEASLAEASASGS